MSREQGATPALLVLEAQGATRVPSVPRAQGAIQELLRLGAKEEPQLLRVEQGGLLRRGPAPLQAVSLMLALVAQGPQAQQAG